MFNWGLERDGKASWRSVKDKRVIIAGTGRSGTTFLVHFLTALGLPTGFRVEDCRAQENVPWSAGLECTELRNYYICKSPSYSLLMKKLLQEGLQLDHVYIPFRDLKQAAGSRARQKTNPGGLWDVKEDWQQEQKLQVILLKIIYDLEEAGEKYTMLDFPRFTSDAVYSYEKLSFLMKKFKIDFQTFSQTLVKVCRPDLIHRY